MTLGSAPGEEEAISPTSPLHLPNISAPGEEAAISPLSPVTAGPIDPMTPGPVWVRVGVRATSGAGVGVGVEVRVGVGAAAVAEAPRLSYGEAAATGADQRDRPGHDRWRAARCG